MVIATCRSGGVAASTTTQTKQTSTAKIILRIFSSGITLSRHSAVWGRRPVAIGRVAGSSPVLGSVEQFEGPARYSYSQIFNSKFTI